MSMNSRERLLTTLQHREPDRVPNDLGGTDVTSICRGAYIDLMRYLGRDPGEIELSNIVEQLPILDDALLDEVIRADTRQIKEQGGSGWTLKIEEDDRYYRYVNEWLIELKMPKEGGHYYDLVGFPMKEPTGEMLDAFPWPDPADPARWEGLDALAKKLYAETDYGLVIGCVFGGGIFEFPQYLRGMESFLLDLLQHPDFADDLMARIAEILITAYSCMLDKVGPYVQVVSICDDLATQRGPMISPELYRRRIKPLQKRLVEAIKARTDAYVLYHGCGATRVFLPDLIEIGIDIFNPVQVSADGLGDTAALKREFGSDLTFWGGVCNPQGTLPFGTPDDVRAETRRRLDDLMPGGGFVAAPIHNIQDNTPPENIMAMYETIHEHGIY
jgi:uroporphyrinogen decarboxylase